MTSIKNVWITVLLHDSIIHFLYQGNNHENTRPTHCDNGVTLKLMHDLLNEPTCNIDKYINNDKTWYANGGHEKVQMLRHLKAYMHLCTIHRT